MVGSIYPTDCTQSKGTPTNPPLLIGVVISFIDAPSFFNNAEIFLRINPTCLLLNLSNQKFMKGYGDLQDTKCLHRRLACNVNTMMTHASFNLPIKVTRAWKVIDRCPRKGLIKRFWNITMVPFIFLYVRC